MPGARNNYSIYIRFNGKKVKIPVNPEGLEIQYPTNNKTYDVLGVGEVVVPREPALKTVSWDGLFPGDLSAPYVNSGAKAPKYYIKRFEEALKEKQVCRLIISRAGAFNTNMKCVVSSFKAADKGGEPGDVYYSVEFKEYRTYGPDTVTIAFPVPLAGGEGGTAPQSAEASPRGQRPVEAPVLRVGASVIVNGEYCYDSFGSRPHKAVSNLSTTVTRIETGGNPYPIHVGDYGWVQEGQLQIVG